jgi:transcription antitermination factor NusG
VYTINHPAIEAVTFPNIAGGSCADRETLRWYAVHTRSRHEKRVSQQLQGKALESFLPIYQSVHRWKDRKAIVSTPLFPGYLFVHIALAQRMQVVAVPGVVNLVGVHGHPTPIPDEEVTALFDCWARRVAMRPHPYLVAGGRVRINKGPLAEMEGILVRRKGQFRLVLSVHLIARSVAVEVDASDVVAVEPAPQKLTRMNVFQEQRAVLQTPSKQ